MILHLRNWNKYNFKMELKIYEQDSARNHRSRGYIQEEIYFWALSSCPLETKIGTLDNRQELLSKHQVCYKDMQLPDHV